MARAKYSNNVLTLDGISTIIAPFATVTLYDPGTTNPFTGDIFQDITGPAEYTNPFQADQYGNIEFFLDSAQRIKLIITGVGLGTVELDYEPVLPDPSDVLTSGTTNLI